MYIYLFKVIINHSQDLSLVSSNRFLPDRVSVVTWSRVLGTSKSEGW